MNAVPNGTSRLKCRLIQMVGGIQGEAERITCSGDSTVRSRAHREARDFFFFNSGVYRKLESNWKITNLIVHEFTAPLACVSAFESNVWVLECASEEDRERKQPTSRGEVETEVSWKGRGQHIAMAVARIRLAAHLLLLLSNPKSWTKATSETLPRLIITSPGRFGNFLSCSVPNCDLIYVASRNFWLAI